MKIFTFSCSFCCLSPIFWVNSMWIIQEPWVPWCIYWDATLSPFLKHHEKPVPPSRLWLCPKFNWRGNMEKCLQCRTLYIEHLTALFLNVLFPPTPRIVPCSICLIGSCLYPWESPLSCSLSHTSTTCPQLQSVRDWNSATSSSLSQTLPQSHPSRDLPMT